MGTRGGYGGGGTNEPNDGGGGVYVNGAGGNYGGVGRIRLDYNSLSGSTIPPHYQSEGPDLRVTLVGPPEVALGNPINYLLRVQNNGVVTAPDVVISQTLPSAVTFEQASISPTTHTGSDLTWEFDELAGLDGIDLYITATTSLTSNEGPALVTTAAVTSALSEANLGNNSDSFTTTANLRVALDFDGVDDYVELEQNIDFSGDSTVEAWVYLDQSLASEITILSRGYVCPSSISSRRRIPYQFGITPQGKLKYQVHSTPNNCGSQGWVDDWYETDLAVISGGQWHHVAMVVQNNASNGRQVKFYVDGQLVPSTQTKNNSVSFSQQASDRTRLGACYREGTTSCANFEGTIDEVRVWNVARTEAEIQNTRDDWLVGDEPGLVGYWRLDENSGQSTTDSTGNSNSGQLGSTPMVDDNDPAWAVGIIPVPPISPVDRLASTITAGPASIPANGVAAGTITVTLKTVTNTVVANAPVTLRLQSGDPTQTYINGQPATDGPINIGLTDVNGLVTTDITSTEAGAKTVSASSGAVALVNPVDVFFDSNLVDPAQSFVSLPGGSTAPATGSDTIAVRVTAKDQFGNLVPNVVASLASSPTITISPASQTTGQNGQATFQVSHDTPVQGVVISATVNGEVLTDTVAVTFQGADLEVSKTVQNQAYAGFPVSYTLTVKNTGPLTATAVVITDTLPAELEYARYESSAGLTFAQTGADLSWQAGDLVPNQQVDITLVATATNTTATDITNVVTATTSAVELETANNSDDANHDVALPAPELTLSPGSPILAVKPGQSRTITMTVGNVGQLAATGLVITAPTVMPWLDITPATLPDLEPGQHTVISLTATPASDAPVGTYRDFVIAGAANGGGQPRAIVRVEMLPPTRTLQLSFTNDQGQPVAGASISLSLPDALVDVTPAFTTYRDVNTGGVTGANGLLTLVDLPLGVYDYGQITAPNHDPLPGGSVPLAAGTGPQVETFDLAARPALQVTPLSPVLAVAPDETASQEITIVNTGAAPLSDLTIDLGDLPNWVYVGAPSLVTTTLQPNESYALTLFASPTPTEQGVTYQKPITISVAGGQSQSVAPTIKVTADNTRDLALTVTDSNDQALAGATVILIRQAPSFQVTGDITRTYQEQFSARSNSQGQVSFTGLPVGGYDYQIRKAGYDTVEDMLSVDLPDSGDPPAQEVEVALSAAPFDYTWEVKPVEVGYEIALTMTHAVDNEGVSLLAPTRVWEFCETGPGLVDNIMVYNVSNAPVTFSDIEFDVPGVAVTVEDFPPSLAAGESGVITVTAAQVSDTVGQGTVRMKGQYLAADNDLVSFTFNPSSVTSPYFDEGATHQQDYVLEPGVFDASANYSLQIEQPSLLDWVQLTTDQTNPFALTAETDITVTLTATAPTWLALNETYTDTAVITLFNANESRTNYLDIEVERTTQGVKLQTTFRLGQIATTLKPLADTGLIYPREIGCGGGPGGGGPTSSRGHGGGWSWAPLPSGRGVRGTRHSSNGAIGVTPPFAEAIEPTDVWVIGEADQQVRLELSQKLMLEGEGFQAGLSLDNLLDQNVDDITVDLIISDTTNALVNSSFIITPVIPTVVTDTLPPNQQAAEQWLILPTLSVTDTEGMTFTAMARISYSVGGASQSFTTLPEAFTVLPAPELEVEYLLPGPAYTCSTFDLEATIHNTGAGSARGVSLSSGQPKLIESTSSTPQGFEIVAVSVDNQPLDQLSLEVLLGDIAPGQSRRIVWRLQTTQPGSFTEFTAGYHQIQNFAGDVLVAPRLTVSTRFTTPADPFVYGCLTDAFQVSGHIRDENGDPITNGVSFLVIPHESGPLSVPYYDYLSIPKTSLATASAALRTPTIDADGFYTLPLPPGTYTIIPLSTALGQSEDPPCEETRVQMFGREITLCANYDVHPDPASESQGEPNVENGAPALTVSGQSQDDNTEADVVVFRIPGVPDPPDGRQFKGANWLRFLDDEKGGVDYLANGIRWNLEYANDIQYVAEKILNLKNDPAGRSNVYTVVRLDQRLPSVDVLPLNEYSDCNKLKGWMDELDKQYTNVVQNNPLIVADPDVVPVFILNNEPNHYNPDRGASDEGRAISAEHYADLYNCYYHHWRIENKNPHMLFVAGPAQHGRPAGTYGVDDPGTEGWETFLANLLPNLAEADGFAIHVYGYYGSKPEQKSLFQDMLNTQLNQIRDSHLANKPVLVTEYNPGVPGDQGNGDAQIPPDPDIEGVDRWQNWFDKTYCWMKDGYAPQVRGALYFTDEEDSNRDLLSNTYWGLSSLDTHDDRRQYWLAAPSKECAQILTMSKSSIGLSSPRTQNQTLSTQIGRTISGAISGTLGIWGYDNVFYVTDDLEVPVNQTLTIAPGTWLVFSPGQHMDIFGRLIVEANTVFPVRFVSADEAGWEGIRFHASANDSSCVGCYIENLSSNTVALQVDAPITFQEGRIRDVPLGTAISSTIPFTLSNVVIDYVGAAFQASGSSAATYAASYLTINRCQQGVVNQGQTLNLDNSIITTCGIAVSTKLSGTTTISYSLLHDNGQDSVTKTGAQLIQGTGILTTVPKFVNFPENFHLQADSPAVNAADPEDDYSREPGYNGNQADLGAYGNTREAPQQPPLNQMAVSLQTDSSIQKGQPGETVTHTLTLRNTGSVTDTYIVSITGNHFRFQTSLFVDGYEGTRQFTLGPQEQVNITIWDEIRVNFSSHFSNTFSVIAVGKYGVQDELQLTTLVSSFQENEGQVVMEAEHFSSQSNQYERSWLSQTNLADYVGSAYLSAVPDTDLQYTTAYTTNSPELQYTINFTTTGTYYVWLRGYAPNGSGDSIYVTLDNLPPAILTGFAPRTWSWANVTNQSSPVTVEVTQSGLHTLHIWQREDGLRLDRILLTADNNYNPGGNGPPESEIR